MAFTTTLTDYYFVVGDTNPTTQVYSTASNAYVANNAAAYDTWLNANNYAFITGVTAAADNGSGLVRLTVFDASGLQTGQRWAVRNVSSDADGIRTITKINATTIDLQGTTFTGATFTEGTVQGAAIIATDVAMRVVINKFAIAVAAPKTQDLVFVAGVATLTNPVADVNQFDTSTVGAKIVLPNMRDPLAPPIGKVLTFKNTAASASSVAVDIVANDGTTVITTVYQGDVVTITLTSNSTANGAFKTAVASISNAVGHHFGLRAIQATSGQNTIAILLDAAVVRDFNGLARYVPFVAAMSASLDISVSGPALNGRDQAGAFSAGDTIEVYFIWGQKQTPGFIASKASSFWTGPNAFPAGYTHFCFLFKLKLDASAKIPVTGLGVFSDLTLNGSTTVPSAATLDLDGTFLHYEVTGNTNITGITMTSGKMVTVKFANNGGTITHGGSIFLPGNANITWAIDDRAIFQSLDNSNVVYCLGYFRADGTPIALAADSVTNTVLANMAEGTVKGRVSSGTGDPEDIARGQLPATATNDNASAGRIGEYVQSLVASGSAVSLTSGVAANITSISLTAGDWDVWVNGFGQTAATTNITFFAVSSSLVSATLDGQTDRVGILALPNAGFTGLPSGQATSKARFSLASTTTIYMVALANFTVSTASAFGAITARRRR